MLLKLVSLVEKENSLYRETNSNICQQKVPHYSFGGYAPFDVSSDPICCSYFARK